MQLAKPTRPAPKDPGSKDLGRGRRWSFRLLAIGLGLLPLLIAEGLCRWAGYGGYPPVLKPLETVGGKTYIASYQPGVDTFFRRHLTVTGGMREQVFTTPEDPDTLRIFCVGGSAMQGYPQPRMLAASSFFQAMLTDVWPDRTVEVLNLGTTAIASFPVVHILGEALEQDPDLVIIYSGNNEFYGAYGVASLHAFGRSTAAMRVLRMARRSALVQWLELRLAGAAGGDSPRVESDKTLMERVIVHDQIAPESPLRRAARRNLGRHLRDMIRRCRQRDVPVIVCTLPANERDLRPIGEEVISSLSESDLAAFQQLLREAEQELPSNPAAAVEQLQAAVDLYGAHARSHFLLGQALAAAGRPEEAAVHFERARELDTMPWRAPGSFNDTVREAAEAGAVLCDLQEAFQAASPGGAIGWELMDDHVHPSLQGQALVARSWVRSMADLPEPLHVAQEAAEGLPDWTEYADRLGTNKFDTYAAARRMVNLFEAPFYRRSNPDGLARFQARLTEIEQTLSGAERTAVRFWRDPETHQQSIRPITGIAGAGLMTEGRFDEADRLLCIARRNVSRYSMWNLELTWKALQCRQQLYPRPRPQDLALAREMVRDGEDLRRATGVSTPALQRHLEHAAGILRRHDEVSLAATQPGGTATNHTPAASATQVSTTSGADRTP